MPTPLLPIDFSKPDFEALPHELRSVAHWVNWNLVQRDGGKPTKVPVNPNTGQNAKTNDPSTWGTFETALERFSEGSVSGLGFCFTDELGIVGVDLDNCCNTPGVLTQEAHATLKELNTYAEFSQSQMGAHALIRGKLPAGARRSGNLEIYQSGRFFVMTGWVIKGLPTVITESQEAVENIHGTLGNRSGGAPAVVEDARYQELLDKITFSADAEPNSSEMDLLRDRSKKFRDTWNRSRPDFNDESPSSYCFSLASQGLIQAWPIQQVVNLIIAWRRKWGADLKLDRPDWYLKHTILKAEAELEVESAAVSLEEDEDGTREVILKNLTTATRLNRRGFHVVGFYQHGMDEARYSIAVAVKDGVKEVRVGTPKELMNVEKLRSVFYSHFGVVIPMTITRARWENMLMNLSRIRELRDEDVDSDTEQVYDWVERHCTVWAPPHDEDSEGGWKGALEHRDPFKKDGCLFVSAVRLRRMLHKDGFRVSQGDLTQLLSLAGFERKKVSARFEKKVVTGWYWRVGLEKFPWV